jgi:hypothetical protein
MTPHARISLSLNASIGPKICYVWSGRIAKPEAMKHTQDLSDEVARRRRDMYCLFEPDRLPY